MQADPRLAERITSIADFGLRIEKQYARMRGSQIRNPKSSQFKPDIRN